MSVTLIAIYSSFSLLQALILAAGVGTVVAAGSAASQDRNQSLAETKEILKQKLLEDALDELGRMNGVTDVPLKEEFEAFRGTLGEKIDRDHLATVAEFHALQKKLRAAELDESQCEQRREAIVGRIAALRSLTGAPSSPLDLLEAEAEKIASSPLLASERLLRLQEMADHVARIEELAAVTGGAELPLTEDRVAFASHPLSENERLILEIRDAADQIAGLDPLEAEKVRSLTEALRADTPFPDRLRRLSRQLRMTCGQLRERILESNFFREKLGDLLPIVQGALDGAPLVRRCETLIGGKSIDRAAFMELYEDIARFAAARTEEIADSLFIGKIDHLLGAMGYEFLKGASLPSPHSVRYLDSPYAGYRVMLKVDQNGTLTVRLVRVVATEAEKNAPTAYQRQKDLETGKKWCGDFDTFQQRMRAEGVPLDVALRQEPEETEVLVVVDPGLAWEKRAATAAPALQRELRGEAG